MAKDKKTTKRVAVLAAYLRGGFVLDASLESVEFDTEEMIDAAISVVDSARNRWGVGWERLSTEQQHGALALAAMSELFNRSTVGVLKVLHALAVVDARSLS